MDIGRCVFCYQAKSDAVLKDEKIELKDKKGNPFSLRRTAFWYDKHHKVYEFITNNYELDAVKSISKNVKVSAYRR